MDDLKPVALIGHGVEVLVFADRAEGVTVTGSPESRAALDLAKAIWAEEPIHLAGNILTSTGEDLPAFISEMTVLFLSQEQVKDAA